MNLIETVCAPGSKLEGGLKSGTGDDRYAFDEAGGWACVIDGATDVGPVRVFQAAESDAARFAEIFARELIAHPISDTEQPETYFDRVTKFLSDASVAEFRMKMEEAPLASLPTAAATWVRVLGGAASSATLGDTLALIETPSGELHVLGYPGKPAEESARVKEVLSRSSAERLAWLQYTRTLHNTPRGYWVFGVQVEAANHILHQRVSCPPGSRILLMTDGFYRLVSPYGRYMDAQLIRAAIDRGLGALLTELRAMEASPADDERLGRLKTSDDATALLFEA